MSRNLVAALENKLVEVAVSATRPTTALHGVDITSWRVNGDYGWPLAAVSIDGSQALNLTSPTGGTQGVELWGYRLEQWWRIGYLNDGLTIDIVGAGQGFAQQAVIIGIFERLAVAGTPSAGTATAKLAPIDSWTTA